MLAKLRPYALVTGLGVLGVLAAGIPGLESGSPTKAYMHERIHELSVQMNLADGTPLMPISGAERITPQQERTLLATVKHPTQTYVKGPTVIDFRAIAFADAKAAGIKRPILFERQMAAESGFQTCVVSGAGAIGIAQIMPSTAQSWHVDPYMPKQALKSAAQHMAVYERQYGSYALALAAYNAGPGAVKSAGMRVPQIAETQNYVHKITDTTVPLLGMSQVFHLPGGLATGFATKLRALRLAVKAKSGGSLNITQGWRSYAEQTDLWVAAKTRYGGWEAAKKWVAPPGCSNHNRGEAADLTGNLTLAHELAPKYGLTFPMSWENWHIEPAGLPTGED